MKKRVITLSLFTVIFAGFFGIFHVYMSQADALKTSNNTITVPLDSYEGKEYFSSFSQEAFTGALQIARIRSMMSAPYDPNAHVKFLYRVEYPEFLSTINTPITNFLSAQIQQAEEDLKVYNAQDQENFPELTGHFDAYSGSGFHTLVFSLSYHVDALFPYQKLQSFLIDDHGMYVSPHDLVALSSENKSAFFTKIRPYLEQQWTDIFSGNLLSDGIDRYIAHPIFAFSGDDIILFFEAGNISHRKNGNISVRVPYLELEDFFSTDPKKTQRLKEQYYQLDTNAKLLKYDKKYVALTFDDGPNDTTTPELLDILQEKWVSATFFVLGQKVNTYPEVLKRAHEAGHEIENHTWDHAYLTRLQIDAIQAEIDSTDSIIKKIIGVDTQFVRPPYGAFNETIEKTIQKPMLMWSVDSRDWKNRNVQKNLATTLPQVKDGSIILFHDIHAESVRTIPYLIDELRRQGYHFLTVEELFKKYQWKIPTGAIACYSGDMCR